ncbi:DinI-like family protein, partial [Escherichia coli]
EKRVFLVILFTSFSGSLVSRISGAVHLSVTRTADKDSAKTFVQETLKDTWESADEWFVR